MHRSEIFAINLRAAMSEPEIAKRWEKHKLLLVGRDCRLAAERSTCTVKLRSDAHPADIFDTQFQPMGDFAYAKIPEPYESRIEKLLHQNELLITTVEGVAGATTVIPFFADNLREFFRALEASQPAMRLTSFDLPPRLITAVNKAVAENIYARLLELDPTLFSLNAQRFLNSTHILSQLFAHSTNLAAQESIQFLEKLRIISDKLRRLLEDYIVKMPKNHHELWFQYQGESISFVDGGMSRIVSLPGVAPTAIRVGIYTVTPGDNDPTTRELWTLNSFLIGNVLGDRTIIEDNEPSEEKRLQEAARYIAEAGSVLDYVNDHRVNSIFLHGPIQNKFETYAEIDPYFIPGVSPAFLEQIGLNEKIIRDTVGALPSGRNGKSLWNAAIPVYLTIQKLLSTKEFPVVGVVERAASNSITEATLRLLVDDGLINDSARNAVRQELNKFDIQDELLFGCILGPGEYIKPVSVKKNTPRRARDRWQDVVEHFPRIKSTMVKTSDHAFPFRVEFASSCSDTVTERTMRLIYHTALLLPNYAFPVGIDIADKFAKIPDWLSKGVSAQLAAVVYKRCVQSGDVRLLEQMRIKLGRSPRDFFYRPSPR